MSSEIIELLTRAKQRLIEINQSLRPESLGRAKNDDLIADIEAVLPQSYLSLEPSSYNSELVYPKK